jgi:hypothetical protein
MYSFKHEHTNTFDTPCLSSDYALTLGLSLEALDHR